MMVIIMILKKEKMIIITITILKIMVIMPMVGEDEHYTVTRKLKRVIKENNKDLKNDIDENK